MSEALRQVVWKCDRCGGDAQAIFGSFPSCKCGSTSFKAAQPPAPTAKPDCLWARNGNAACQGAQPVQQHGAEPVTLADVLDALNCFNRPKPNEDDGPWEGGHYIRVDHLPAFINVIAAAWFAPAQRQPLSDEEIEAIWKAHVLPGFGERQKFYSPVVYARAIEAAHGIAAAPQAQKG